MAIWNPMRPKPKMPSVLFFNSIPRSAFGLKNVHSPFAIRFMHVKHFPGGCYHQPKCSISSRIAHRSGSVTNSNAQLCGFRNIYIIIANCELRNNIKMRTRIEKVSVNNVSEQR